ncbi:hypothetical protein BDV96DRAFT_14628 [Lophiotrema nucula]|uniref:Protein kinase domain-containing protein n=1 Tax=Lophiotrema nucula TaxID=690887 RepID=A0A6A5ZVY5_9PLEO|nr:hypothetical protein BDV96DRAFT_14628 [Lophiotrema nucula]
MDAAKAEFCSQGYVRLNLPIVTHENGQIYRYLSADATCPKEQVQDLKTHILAVKFAMDTESSKQAMLKEAQLLNKIKTSVKSSKDEGALSRFCLAKDIDDKNDISNGSWFMMDSPLPPINLAMFIERWPCFLMIPRSFIAHVFVELYLTVDYLHNICDIAHKSFLSENIYLDISASSLVQVGIPDGRGLPGTKLTNFGASEDKPGIESKFKDIENLCRAVSTLANADRIPDRTAGSKLLLGLIGPERNLKPLAYFHDFADLMCAVATNHACDTSRRFSLEDLGKKCFEFALEERKCCKSHVMDVFMRKVRPWADEVERNEEIELAHIMRESEKDPSTMLVKK